MHQFIEYIPVTAQGYCSSLAITYTFNFKLKNNRLTKLGDFRHDKRAKQFTISVNRDLNPFQFLITYIHELAHLKVAVDHQGSTKAHGKEWKTAFQELLRPVLTKDVFPEPLLLVLQKHMINPKAAAGSDPKLWAALKNYDSITTIPTLDSVKEGDTFIFRKKEFVKIEKRRTRVLCKEIKSGRLYLIPGIADVQLE
jgi:hypothetical protein